jgi:hypothetical protein
LMVVASHVRDIVSIMLLFFYLVLALFFLGTYPCCVFTF